jgi:hypothetical protein
MLSQLKKQHNIAAFRRAKAITATTAALFERLEVRRFLSATSQASQLPSSAGYTLNPQTENSILPYNTGNSESGAEKGTFKIFIFLVAGHAG